MTKTTCAAIIDANETFNGPETVRELVCDVADFAKSANPFAA